MRLPVSIWRSQTWVQMRVRQAAFADPFVGAGGAPGHIGWRWDWLLEKGVEGYIKDLQMRLSEVTDEREIINRRRHLH